MPAPAQPAAIQSVTTLDNAADSPTTALYRAAIGPINNDYYLPIFKRFEATDRVGPSWNLAASLYTLNWMVFRRLWRPAFAYIATMLTTAMVLGLAHVLFEIPQTTEVSIWLATGLLSFLIPGFYGNALLHADCRKKMARALATSRTMLQATAWLNTQASTRKHFIWLVLVNLVLIGAAGASYWFVQSLPAQKLLTPQIATAPNVAPAPLNTNEKLALATPPTPVEPAASAPAPALAASLPVDVFVPRRPLFVLPESTTTAPDAQTPAPVAYKAPKEKIPAPITTREEGKQGKAYYVNVGLFADALNANNAKSKLSSAGLTAFTEELKTAKGQRTRVRVGPFATESAATGAANKIRSLKLDAVVTAPSRN